MSWQTIGFEKIKNFFEKASATASLSHAYLFFGQEMIGKRTFTRELVSRINNRQLTDSDPALLYLEASLSDGQQTIGIEKIRRARDFLALTPPPGERKFLIINDAHLMTTEAQNTLLKVLEEPSGPAVIILISAYPQLLLPTVRSRCQEIEFSPPPQSLVAEFVKRQKIPPAQADLLIRFTNGRLGLVKKILTEKAILKIEKTLDQLAELGRADLEERFEFAQKASDVKRIEELQAKVLFWLLGLRLNIGQQPKSAKILSGLLSLNRILRQPQFNHRLAFENFLINL